MLMYSQNAKQTLAVGTYVQPSTAFAYIDAMPSIRNEADSAAEAAASNRLI